MISHQGLIEYTKNYTALIILFSVLTFDFGVANKQTMNRESLFISLSAKIRKHLELTDDQEKFTYYEALNIKETFSIEELFRALGRAKELLERLKYHPTYKNEAEDVSNQFLMAAEVLKNPKTRKEYDQNLAIHQEQMKKKKSGHFAKIVSITAGSRGLTEDQRKDLYAYAPFWNIDSDEASFLIDDQPDSEESTSQPLASPPSLTAPSPKYWETVGFQRLLKQNAPLLRKITELRCSGCGKRTPVSFLHCSCGALMRGKIICMECGALLPHTSSECPECGRESNLMLALSEKDIQKVYKAIDGYIDQKKYESAQQMGKDLLAIRPGDQTAHVLLSSIKKHIPHARAKKDKHHLEQEALNAWNHNKTFEACKKLVRASQIASLSEEGMRILEQASQIVIKTRKKISFFFLLLGIILLIMGVAGMGVGVFWESVNVILAGIAGVAVSLPLLIVGIIYYILSRRQIIPPVDKQ